jgi:molybdenum cofactor cytidylyltransferase
LWPDNFQMHHPISAVIPAAGSSGRMGSNKGMLLTGSGVTFAEHQALHFANYGCTPVVLVVNEQFDTTFINLQNLLTVVNHHPQRGRSWSIQLGLNQVPASHACFIQNVDNPHLASELLDNLARSVPDNGYAVPVFAGHGGHPILLGSHAVEFLRLHRDGFDFRKALQCLPRVEIPWRDEGILWNINTPEDYRMFFSRDGNSQKKS